MFPQLPEAKRLAYLQAMGVESFFPRRELPGAPPPVLCETLPEPGVDTPVVAEPFRENTAPVSAPNTGLDREALLKELAPKSAVAAVKAEQSAPAPVRAEKIQFNLRFIQVPGLAMIVDSSPLSSPEPLIQRFAANLLLAIAGLSKDWEGQIKANFQQHLFKWPLVGNRQIEQGEQAAREAVSAAILANCERQGIARILLLGEQAVDYAAADYPGCRVLSSYAIAHFLQEPLSKRELWQSLKAWA